MHYYKRNLGDYAKKAGRLSMLQHGSYTLLIDACYDREAFPTLEEALEWTWASTTEEMEAVSFVLRKFFTLENGVYVQKRIEEEIAEYHGKAETNKRIAVERETKRKEKSTDRARTVNETPPNHKPLTKNHKPSKSKTETPSASPKYSALNDLIEKGVNPQVAQDWLDVRKLKKSAPTKTAIDKILELFTAAGMSADEGVRVCCLNSWSGFNKKWLDNQDQARSQTGGPWWATDATILAKAAEMKIKSLPGESASTLKGRIQAAIDNGGEVPRQATSTVTVLPVIGLGAKPDGLDLKALVKHRASV